mmetsp:Transcript_51372/g.58206  ORF Transcript_51372/g.58206 Transcript_51372/m.58206 type:complete len:81 (-) Transcript_51372:585-827(-)
MLFLNVYNIPSKAISLFFFRYCSSSFLLSFIEDFFFQASKHQQSCRSVVIRYVPDEDFLVKVSIDSLRSFFDNDLTGTGF